MINGKALGKEAMEKYEKIFYDNMVKKYEEESGETRNMFEAEKRRAVQIAEENLRLKYENYVETLREEFEEKLQVIINNDRLVIFFYSLYEDMKKKKR